MTATRSDTHTSPGRWSTHPDPGEMLVSRLDPMGVMRRCGATFHAASLMLPASVRRELAVLYAFCRVIDDCGDLVSGPSPARARALLDTAERCLGGRSDESPIISEFRELASRRGVPLSLAHELIEGVRADTAPVRIATSAELVRYAYRVASTVGLMMCRVLGVPRQADPFAIDLGIGMQLTNIARDVREDALNDRVYLPGSFVDHERVLGCVADDGVDHRVTGAVVELLDLADRYYASADDGMRYLPGAVRPGIRAAAVNYRAIGAVIRRDPSGALRGRVSTSRRGKLARSGGVLCVAAAETLTRHISAPHDTTLHAPLRPLIAGPAAG